MRTLIFTAFLLSSAQTLALAAPDAPGDTEAFFVEQIDFVPRLLVDYCIEAAPESRISLEQGREEFRLALGPALAPVLQRFRAEGAFGKPVSAGDWAQLDEVKRRMRAEIAKVEPHAYCRQLALKLRSTDANALVRAAEQRYLQLLTKARQR